VTFVRSLSVSLVCLLALASGCGRGAATSVKTGLITGVASPCVGVAKTENQIAKMPVRVTLTQRSRTVASQVVYGSHTYRFTEPKGQYLVSSDQSGVTPASVTLHTGEVARINLFSPCM